EVGCAASRCARRGGPDRRVKGCFMMSGVDADQTAAIHRLAAEFIGDLEGRGFHRSQIATVMTGLGVSLAAACNDPGALALVIEAALLEIDPQCERADHTGWSASDAAIAALRPAQLSCPGEPS